MLAAIALLPRKPTSEVNNLAVQLSRQTLPYGVLDCEIPGVDTIYINRPQGVYESVRYLAEKGHRNVIYLGSPNPNRLDGYQRAVVEFGLIPGYLLRDVQGAMVEFTQGREAATAFAEMKPRPSAVQAHTDFTALGFLAGLHDLGIRVPEEVAVVGFDDRLAAACCWPALTTVAQPNREAGVALGQMLLRKIRGEPTPPEGWSQTLPTRLVIRDSA